MHAESMPMSDIRKGGFLAIGLGVCLVIIGSFVYSLLGFILILIGIFSVVGGIQYVIVTARIPDDDIMKK